MGCRAPPGRWVLRSLCPTGSRWAPQEPYRPCPGPPGVLGPRSWAPRGPVALEGCVHSGKSREVLLPYLPRTCQVTNQPRHTGTDVDRCDPGQPNISPDTPPANGHVRSQQTQAAEHDFSATVRGSNQRPRDLSDLCAGLALSLTCCVSLGKASPSLCLIFPIWQMKMMIAYLVTS